MINNINVIDINGINNVPMQAKCINYFEINNEKYVIYSMDERTQKGDINYPKIYITIAAKTEVEYRPLYEEELAIIKNMLNQISKNMTPTDCKFLTPNDLTIYVNNPKKMAIPEEILQSLISTQINEQKNTVGTNDLNFNEINGIEPLVEDNTTESIPTTDLNSVNIFETPLEPIAATSVVEPTESSVVNTQESVVEPIFEATVVEPSEPTVESFIDTTPITPEKSAEYIEPMEEIVTTSGLTSIDNSEIARAIALIEECHNKEKEALEILKKYINKNEKYDNTQIITSNDLYEQPAIEPLVEEMYNPMDSINTETPVETFEQLGPKLYSINENFDQQPVEEQTIQQNIYPNEFLGPSGLVPETPQNLGMVA